MKSGASKGNREIPREINKRYNRLKEFYDNAQEGITVVDVNTLKFIDYNANALKLFNFTSSEILTQGFVTISPEFQPDGRRTDEKAKELIEKALNGKKPVFEWVVKTGNGEMMFCEVRLALLSKKSKTQRIYASFIDIRDRKRTETKIILQNKRLSEIRFLQSHQVREPIANILGLVNLFNFKNLNDPLNAELIVKLELVTKRFDSIINDIVGHTDKIDALALTKRAKAEYASNNKISAEEHFF